MNRRNIIIVVFVVLIAVFAVWFLVSRKKGIETTSPKEEKGESLGAEIFAQSQNPLAQAAVTANPFASKTNPFTANTNPFAEETNPLKSFYKNPFQ